MYMRNLPRKMVAVSMATHRFLGKSQETPEMLDARLYLHYEFPPYSVNETGRVRSS